MGTTFVSITNRSDGTEPGFWMQDGMLEIWLRLLALHLPEPNDGGEHELTLKIRDQWLIASRGFFTGCVPHGMEDACSTQDGREVVRSAINSLMNELSNSDSPVDADTINLLGIEGDYSSIERERLRDIGLAFRDLINGRIDGTPRTTEIMPGSIPYQPQKAT